MVKRILRKLLRSEKGAAGLEFALILPAMLFIYLGGSYVSSLAALNKKLHAASYAVNNLVPYPRDYCSYRAFARNFHASGGAKQMMGEFLAPYSVAEQPMMIQYTESAPDVDNLVTVRATARYGLNTGFWGVVNSVAAHTPGATDGSGMVPSVFNFTMTSPGVTVKKNPATTCPAGVLRLEGPAVTEFVVGEHNSFTVKAEDGIPAYQINLASALPPDLSFATDGMQADVSGVIPETCTTGPCNPETFNVTIAAQDSSGALWAGSGNVSAQKNFQIRLIHSLRLTVGSETATVGTPFQSSAPNRQGGKPGYTYSISGQPAGLAINATTGIVSGTPTTPGTYDQIIVTLRDARGSTVSDDRMVYEVKPPALTAFVDGSFNGVGGINHAVGIHARGGWGVITVSCSGFPAGLTCGPASKATPYDGAVSGAAQQLGSGTGTITFRDATGQVATTYMSWNIQPPALSAWATGAMNGQAGSYVRSDVAAQGGWGNLWVVSVSGAPSGIGLSHVGYWQWALSGTAPSPAAGNITVVIGDQAGQRATAVVGYNYTAPPLSTSTSGHFGTQVCCTSTYTEYVYSSGGWGAKTASASGLPAGMSMSWNGERATISGRPSAAGSGTIQVTVRDSVGQTSVRGLNYNFTPAVSPVTIRTMVEGADHTAAYLGVYFWDNVAIVSTSSSRVSVVKNRYGTYHQFSSTTPGNPRTFSFTWKDANGLTNSASYTWSRTTLPEQPPPSDCVFQWC
ncbi:putative Ig domain-containing protein [Microvirga sp. BT688]|uniref:putative Ig domain-containing protein n=1 Tax=Microvirga sp. TaxID=1873136 RepID=UPI001683393F|nr:putative Ig domain-containing protein [Microvirga sp.]MBD2745772.1 putative Ig domain-containing protein [Microvirga sp.]